MRLSIDWAFLNTAQKGRENLGDTMPVGVYRLMQYAMRDVLVDRFGDEETDEIIRTAGYRAGASFFRQILPEEKDFSTLIATLQQKMREYSMGVLRVEASDIDALRFTMTVSEDLDCSGLPVTGQTACVYDEGFIAAILEAYAGVPFSVTEVDCWATGDRTCRFVAEGKREPA